MATYGQPDTTRAKYFAEISHAGQTYNADVPYTFHLEQVVKVLERFGETEVAIVSAAYLHDTIEDTGRSYNDIATRFGEEVAELVYAVSNELGRNRKERAIKTYPKIRANERAIKLKLADRIANVEYGLANGGKTEMYRKEFVEFRKGIELPGKHVEMWEYLERLLK